MLYDTREYVHNNIVSAESQQKIEYPNWGYEKYTFLYLAGFLQYFLPIKGPLPWNFFFLQSSQCGN